MHRSSLKKGKRKKKLNQYLYLSRDDELRAVSGYYGTVELLLLS